MLNKKPAINSWIERWSQLRKKELMSVPDEFPIHPVYQTVGTPEEIKNGLNELRSIFLHCYADILNDPADMLLPVYDIQEYGYFSKEARLSRELSYHYAKAFYVLGYCGELTPQGELSVPVDTLKEQCKALKLTKINDLLHILGNYGIVADGLGKGRLKPNTTLTLSAPDHRNLILTLYILAVKASRVNRFKDFCRLNYKLLAGDWDTVEYGEGVDAVADFLHSQQEQAAAQLIHQELIKRNYYYNFQDWNEGPQIRYYKKEGDRNRNTNASFWLASMDTELKFFFRIKDMEQVLAYLKTCPEYVSRNFLVSDKGCTKRFSGKCVSGISYQLHGNLIWRCGCCHPNFQVSPRAESYLYYINAAELSAAVGKPLLDNCPDVRPIVH